MFLIFYASTLYKFNEKIILKTPKLPIIKLKFICHATNKVEIYMLQGDGGLVKW